ncbi:flagellar hook-basal body complex protein FlhO [Paenibacillus silvae]|uniref:Flagellar hook-basal body complex protein FlhO n=1 Tax=Paenibacillus silvae TaxID=1325358 RepID=A0ABQ1ZI66_9BACL|nr:flagellar hook-basal body protein [Paenibacillus silvae]GGH64586.1 flagellar hook-basal body complex protein FlhO [Paenibacillus silvae]
MLRGLYTAAAGMITEQRRHDTATQNIVNMNTTGYKQVNSVNRAFPEMLITLMGADANLPTKRLGKLNSGVFAEESLSMNVQGALMETKRKSDFAISSNLSVNDPQTREPIQFDASGKFVRADGTVIYQPQAYFTVRDANGDTRYTRDGHFDVNGTGQLLSSTGAQVLDSNGQPIVLTGAVEQFKVDEQGRLLDAATGAPTAVTLGINIIDQPNQLVRQGDGNFSLNEDAGATARGMGATDVVRIQQGYLEGSNVDASQATVDMNAAFRAYEANQKVVQFYDRSLDKAVNEVGRV